MQYKIRYKPPITDNNFPPRTPSKDEYFTIIHSECIHCKVKYDGKQVMFTNLSDGKVIWWHKYRVYGDCSKLQTT